MKIVTRIAEIQEELALVAPQPDATVALVPVHQEISPEDIVALRHADKLCDVAVVTCLDGALDAVFQKYLEEAGAKLLYHPTAHKPAAELKVLVPGEGENLTHALQVLLAMMPSAVVVNQENLPMVQTFKRFENTFPNLFTLVIPQTPAHIRGEEQERLLNGLMFAQELVDSGERTPQAILRYTMGALEKGGFQAIEQLTLVDVDSLHEVRDKIHKPFFLFAEVKGDNRTLRQSAKISL